MDGIDKSAAAAARELNSPSVRLSAWWATRKVRSWLWWAVACPTGLRNALVPGWRYVYPLLYSWLRLDQGRADYSRLYLGDMAGPYARALARGRSLTRLFQIVEYAAGDAHALDPLHLPPIDVQARFRASSPAASEEAKPFHPGVARAIFGELDHMGALTETGKVSMLARHEKQMAHYAKAMDAWCEAVAVDARYQRQNPVTWRNIAASTMGQWSALGLLPPDVIE